MFDFKSVLLAKIETGYAVDPTPAAATDAFLVIKPNIEIIGNALARDVVTPAFGSLAPINVGTGLKVTFGLELKGSGAAGTAPKLGTLLRACNLTQTIIAGVKVDYDPNSSETGESVTIYLHKDGRLHKIMGCVGTVKVNAKVNERAMLDFEFTGLYAGTHASDVACPTPVFTETTLPPLFRAAALALGGYAAIIESFAIDLGNSIEARPDANAASGIARYYVAGRAVKGSLDPEVVALATFDPFTLWSASTSGALTATIGQTAGNKCTVTMPAVVPELPKYGARGPVMTYGLSFASHITAAAGNNEVKLSFL